MSQQLPRVIITCAVTGNLTTPEQTPHLPITPKQIADSALEASEAGAAIVHLHVRDPESGRPSMAIDLYGEVVERPGQAHFEVDGDRLILYVPADTPAERRRQLLDNWYREQLRQAIPAVIAYNKFSTDFGRYAGRLDGFSTEFSAILSRQLDEKG